MLRKLRRTVALVLVLCMVLPAAVLAADDGYEGVITLVHTNDVHSNVAVEPYVKGYVDALRAEGRDVVLISGGDAFKGTAFASMTDGLDVAKVMNMAGYQLFAMGNHEQFLGIEKFGKVVEAVDFPVLAANVGSEWREAIPDILDYVIMEFGGTKIAFIGITTPVTGDKEGSAKIIEAAERAKADAEAEGAAIFIAVAHLGIVDTDVTIRSTYLAEKCPWLTAVIDAHCHTAHENGLMQGGVLIAETGEYGNNIGVVELTLAAGKVTDVTARLIPIKGHEADCGITPDAEIQAFIDEVNEKSAVFLSEIVTATPVDLDGVRSLGRVHETNLGNIVTDAMLLATGADISLMIGPSLRDNIPAGDIARGQLQDVLYEDVDIWVVEATGREIYDIMEFGVSAYPKENNLFTHPAGIAVEYIPALGNTLKSIKMADGSAFRLDAVYMCAVRSDNLVYFFPDASYSMGYGTICEAFIRYIDSGAEISREVAGRIKAVDTAFSDIGGHWAEAAILEMMRLQGVSGYPDGTFRPNEAVTGAALAKLLTAAFALSDEDALFADIGDTVTRQDVALSVAKLLDHLGIDLPQSAVTPFADLADASDEAAEAIGALQSAGLINGVGGGRFAPLSGATRAEVSAIVSRALTAYAPGAAA